MDITGITIDRDWRDEQVRELGNVINSLTFGKLTPEKIETILSLAQVCKNLMKPKLVKRKQE